MDDRKDISRITLQKSIVLLENHAKNLINYAKSINPNESCAILFGKIENRKSNVKDIFLAKNIENSPINFTISNDELIKAYNEAEKRNLEIVGIFHSHPDSKAYPSLSDMKYMEINTIPWIIYSNKDKEFKAFILESEIIPIIVEIK